jgi:hypothetical protein
MKQSGKIAIFYTNNSMQIASVLDMFAVLIVLSSMDVHNHLTEEAMSGIWALICVFL